MNVNKVYGALLAAYGPQGWWPMQNAFSPPEFEVCIGAILTQNTNWKNVERALSLMKERGITTPEDILAADINELEEAVRPSGYFRQKAERLKTFTEFVMSFGGFEAFRDSVTREQLLSVNGLGPETVDSMLLYALGRKSFVIDAYTRRIFTRLGLQDRKGYDEWRKFFEDNVDGDAETYEEFHALIVEHAKSFCRTEPACSNCFLRNGCAHAENLRRA